jgi:hypothetical protein
MLHVQVYDGQMPWQLGALSKMKGLTVAHYCLTGALPPHLIHSWPDLKSLVVTSPVQRYVGSLVKSVG